ncbi:MAG: P27 family phage terminase small subunit [Xanthobacteraceae bacterium]
MAKSTCKSDFWQMMISNDLMRQRGRKSAAQLSILGTRPHLVASSPPDVPPAPPPHLGEPERQIWDDVVRDFRGTSAAFAVLTSGLEAHMRARECRAILAEEGLTVTGRDGQTKAHPLCTVERQYLKAFQQTFHQLKIKL